MLTAMLIGVLLVLALLWRRADRRWRGRPRHLREKTSRVALMFTPSRRHRS